MVIKWQSSWPNCIKPDLSSTRPVIGSRTTNISGRTGFILVSQENVIYAWFKSSHLLSSVVQRSRTGSSDRHVGLNRHLFLCLSFLSRCDCQVVRIINVFLFMSNVFTYSRKSKVIIASSGVFLISMCIGGMLMFGSVAAFVSNTNIGCNLFIWMLPVGFALLFGWVFDTLTFWHLWHVSKHYWPTLSSDHCSPRQDASICCSRTSHFNLSSTLIVMLALVLEWSCWVSVSSWLWWWDFNPLRSSSRTKATNSSHSVCSTSPLASLCLCTTVSWWCSALSFQLL